MKLFKLQNINFSDLSSIDDKDVVGLIAMILTHGSDQAIDIDSLLDYGYTKEEINAIFQKLKDYFQVTRTPYGFSITNNLENDSNVEQRIKDFWGINLSNIKECLNSDKPIFNLTNLIYQLRSNLPAIGANFNQELDDLFYQSILAGDVVNHYQVILSRSDIDVINHWLYKCDISINVFKFCFIESIETSNYQNFANQYFDKIINTYNKQKINSIEAAKIFKQQRNEYLASNSKQYVEPVYDDTPTISVTKEDQESIKEFLS